jgi:hypothetical protein
MAKGKTRTKRGKDGAADGGSAAAAAAPVVSDSRFSAMHSAPTFQRVKADSRKVKLDDRFAAVLTDKRFQVSNVLCQVHVQHAPTTAEKPHAKAHCGVMPIQ